MGMFSRKLSFGFMGFLVGAILCSPALAIEVSPLVLDAMEEELSRNHQAISMEGYESPYFIGYTVRDTQESFIQARFGALTESTRERKRVAYVEVRVGDYQRDNTLDKEGQSYDEMSLMQADVRLPTDNDLPAIRRALWLLTDQRYKEALTAYHRVKGSRVYRKEDSAGAFSREEPVKHMSEGKIRLLDEKKWSGVARQLSAVLMDGEGILDGSVEITHQIEVRYQVNSEGTRLMTQKNLIGVHITASTLAEDGSVLDYGINHYAPGAEQLPNLGALTESAVEVRAHLVALRKAPTLAPYTGPAILMPRAAGVLFHEAIGHRLEGHRQEDPEEGRTFAGQVGETVLPTFLTVKDDPTLSTYEGTPLNGHYEFDDEGVSSKPVVLIEKGVLRNYLMSRKPIEGASSSNGHGRSAGIASPVGRMGNLRVEAEGSVTLEELKKQLIKEVRTAGKPFGLIIGDVTGGSTNTMNYGYQAFKGGASQVFKVDVETGALELVRGVEIVGTPLSSINKVVAASEESGVFNGYCGAESGYVPVGTISPALLLREIELQRSMRSRQKGPILPAPKKLRGGPNSP